MKFTIEHCRNRLHNHRAKTHTYPNTDWPDMLSCVLDRVTELEGEQPSVMLLMKHIGWTGNGGFDGAIDWVTSRVTYLEGVLSPLTFERSPCPGCHGMAKQEFCTCGIRADTCKMLNKYGLKG